MGVAREVWAEALVHLSVWRAELAAQLELQALGNVVATGTDILSLAM